MSKGVSRPIRYYPFHENGVLRRANFESFENALNDDKGALALFRGQVEDAKRYGKALFVVMWNKDDNEEAVIARYDFPNDELIRVWYHRGRAESFIKQFKKYERNPENLGKVQPFLEEIAELANVDISFATSPKPERQGAFDCSLADDLMDIYDLSDDEFLAEYQSNDASADGDDVTALAASVRSQVIAARIGQGKFRNDVISLWGKEHCAVTLVDIPEMLVASHIKAWKDCNSTDERLDDANGILLCAHVDKLFDRYLITFIPDAAGRYHLECSKALDHNLLISLGIVKGEVLNTSHLNLDALERFKGYMQLHNDEFHQRQSESG